MRNKLSSIVISGVGGALLLISFAVAQQPGTSPGEGGQQQGQGASMSMDDMMKTCREHCQQGSTSMDQLATQLQEARESNDPAKMRAALEATEKPLNEMRDHMRMCMGMMDMMQHMHGGMGGMMHEHGQQEGERQSEPNR